MALPKKRTLPSMSTISSADKRRLGDFIRRCKNYTLHESEVHKSTAKSLIKNGLVVRMDDGRLIVVMPVYDAYRAHFWPRSAPQMSADVKVDFPKTEVPECFIGVKK